ncbi:MAG: Chemotaxis protein CheY [Haliscomenobacter sp.]|jgi:DNA-binding response OmpR family regulator|nr:Chemotaxis protein CheY [Haliscomenobacter sp.]
MKPTIVFVDDNEMMRAFLKMYYGQIYSAVVFSNAHEAYHWLHAGNNAQMIVADYRMPGATGLDLLKRVKQDPQLRHLPFFILSGEAESKDRIAALEAGASDYIPKPFHPKELELRIQRFLA